MGERRRKKNNKNKLSSSSSQANRLNRLKKKKKNRGTMTLLQVYKAGHTNLITSACLLNKSETSHPLEWRNHSFNHLYRHIQRSKNRNYFVALFGSGCHLHHNVGNVSHLLQKYPSTTHAIISIKAIVFTVQQKEWEETDGQFFSKKFKKQKRAIGFNGIKKKNPQSLHKTFGNSPQPKTSSCGVFLVLATRGRKVTIAVQTDLGIYIQNRSTLE